MTYFIYNQDYQPHEDANPDGYSTIQEATAFLLDDIITHEWPYMIGTDDGIEAFVFQGRVYRGTINGR